MGTIDLAAQQLIDQMRTATSTMKWIPEHFGPLSNDLSYVKIQGHPGLDYAHHNWSLPRGAQSGSRKSARSMIRRVIDRAVFGSLVRYLNHEQELIANLVRLNDALAKRSDELADAHNRLIAQLDERTVRLSANQAQLASLIERIEKYTPAENRP